MIKQFMIVFGIAIVAFAWGYSLQLQKSDFVINDRDDLLDTFEKLDAELRRSDVPIYYHDFEQFFVFNDVFIIVPVNAFDSNAYTITDPWDYELWKAVFFN